MKHKLTHSGIKPYACDHPGCKYMCTHSGRLGVHKRTVHDGIKPYACDHVGCPYKSSDSGNLARHKRSHCGDKPFQCNHPECEYKCSASGNLVVHKRMMHTLEGQARQKKQEQRIANMLDRNGIEYKREHQVDFTCIGDVDGSFARVDFLMILHGYVVFLEVDEGQHRFGYGPVSCDMRRMAKIVESLCLEGNNLPVVFVRYNPDAFSVDGARVSCLKRDRESTLIAMLTDASSDIYSSGRALSILYMYYDTTGGQVDVVASPDYDQTMADCCCNPVLTKTLEVA